MGPQKSPGGKMLCKSPRSPAITAIIGKWAQWGKTNQSRELKGTQQGGSHSRLKLSVLKAPGLALPVYPTQAVGAPWSPVTRGPFRSPMPPLKTSPAQPSKATSPLRPTPPTSVSPPSCDSRHNSTLRVSVEEIFMFGFIKATVAFNE